MPDNSDLRLLLLPLHQEIEVLRCAVELLKRRLETTQRESAEWYDKTLALSSENERLREKIARIRELVKE